MAKLRTLKKDIDYLVSEVISDCYTLIYLYPERKEGAFEIVNNTVEFRNHLFERANNPDGKADKKLAKIHYKNINKDLLTGIDNLFIKISELTKK